MRDDKLARPGKLSARSVRAPVRLFGRRNGLAPSARDNKHYI